MELCDRSKCGDTVWCTESNKAVCYENHECSNEHLDLKKLKKECLKWIEKEFDVLEENCNVMGCKQMNEMEEIENFLDILMKRVSELKGKFREQVKHKIECILEARKNSVDIVEKVDSITKNEEVKEIISKINKFLQREIHEVQNIETFIESINKNKQYSSARLLHGVYYKIMNDPLKTKVVEEKLKEMKTSFEQALKKLQDQMNNVHNQFDRLTGVRIKGPGLIRNKKNRCTY